MKVFHQKRTLSILFINFAAHFVKNDNTILLIKADIMKITTLTLALMLLFGAFSCRNKSKSDEIASYDYSSKVKLSKVLEERVGSWIKEGIDCYGIIVVYSDQEKNVLRGKSIKAKTLVITEKAIKMKALESVNMSPKQGCSKMGLEEGDTWWENEGDLFQTREEADAYIKKLMANNSTPKNDHFTVD